MRTQEESIRLLLRGLECRSAGLLDEAGRIFRSLMPSPQDDMLTLLLTTMLPPVCSSMDELLSRRNAAIDTLTQLQQRGFQMDLTNKVGVPWMDITYQGMNDRVPQQILANLQRAPSPPQLPQLHRNSTKDRIRLGLISVYFRDHTIGKLMRGLIANLSREDFLVTIFGAGNPTDKIADFCRAHADVYVQLPSDLVAARSVIIGQKLDILFYTDIGMEPTSFTLAHSRLAPVQCVTWGHPETTGMPTIDYFISSQDLDPVDGQDAYTERLVRLKNIAIYYYRPPPPPAQPRRAEFGLPEKGTLYGCLQTLTKFHPEFDALLAQILRRDPTGILVLLAGQHAAMTDALMDRFKQTMPDVVSRVRVMPRMNWDPFLRLNVVMDLMLDPIHFGGGNTCYEALSYGIPIVTWPSQFLRGRITYALYKTMNMTDCIANTFPEYVDLAVRLGTDPQFRQSIREKILATNSILYENPAGIRDLEEFFKSTTKISTP